MRPRTSSDDWLTWHDLSQTNSIHSYKYWQAQQIVDEHELANKALSWIEVMQSML